MLFISSVFASSAPRPVIIDTDVGLDDVLAISYLLQQPSIQVKAITIAATGETPCLRSFVNLRKMLKQLDKTDIPVFCGRAKPLQGNHQFPSEWSLFQKKVAFQPIKINAVQEIKKLLTHSSQPYDIIAIGPLTNLGELFQKSPELTQKVNRVYIMGGALHVPGNLREANKSLNNVAEWNIYIDPYAANIVFQSGLPITLIPLDLTNHVLLPPKFYRQLKNYPTKTAKYLYQIYTSLPKTAVDAMNQINWYAWDTLAAVIAVHPQFAQMKKEKVFVQVAPEYDSGSMRIDEVKGRAVDVCYGVDKEKFSRSLMEGIVGL